MKTRILLEVQYDESATGVVTHVAAIKAAVDALHKNDSVSVHYERSDTDAFESGAVGNVGA